MQSLRRNAAAIVVGFAGCALMVLVQRWLPETISGILVSLLYLTAVFLAGILGGWKSGAMTSLLGIAAALFLFSPAYIVRATSKPIELFRLFSFLVLGGFLSALTELLQRAWRRIDDRQRQLAEEVRLRLQAQLAEQIRADELMITLASIADGVITTDSDGLVTFLNSAAEKLVGWSADEARGHRLADICRLVDEQTLESIPDPILQIQQIHSSTDHASTLLVSKDGTHRSIDSSVAPIRDRSGYANGMVIVIRDLTETRRTQKALQDQQLRALSILESITEAFFSLNRDWRFTYVNGPAGRLLGRTPQSLINHLIWEEFPGFVSSDFELIYRNAMDLQKEGGVTGFYPDHQCYYEVHAYPAADGISVLFNDVSDRERAEKERETLLRQIDFERARLAEIFRHAPSFMCVLTGPDHVVERMNDRYLELIGQRSVVGLAVRDAFPEVAGQGYFEILDQVYQSGEPYFGTDQPVTLERNGRMEERVADFVYQPLKNENGQITAVLLQGIDRTERKKAELALARVTAESERHRRMFETALSNTPDFVYLFDCDGRFTFVNKSLLALWQKPAVEVLGKNFFELNYPPDLAHLLHSQIEDVVRTHQPVRDEVLFTSSLGTRSYEHIFVPVFGSNGEIEAVAGSTRDITDRKESEEALRQADRNKDDFLALLAHELRNPLAPIRNGLQVLRLTQNREDQERTQAMMDRQLTHLVRLTDDLLDVSRINRHKMELRRAPLALKDAIDSAVETAMPAIESAGHQLKILLPQEPVFLDADLTRLAQVFSNLLTNSARYTNGPGVITLQATREADEVTVKVKDTGIGIPAESIPYIFDMFSQVDRSIERSTGGLGIGLALVKGLVEMHGGTVVAESAGLNCGSEFTVRLPVLVTERKDDMEDSNASTTNGSTKTRTRILVVDDNRDSAESMRLMLQLLGNEVSVAFDGIEAVAAAEEYRPDVILMDVGMPRLNGLDATRQIREHDWGSSMVIIALTGWGQDSDRDQSRNAGCNGHLVKPVSLQDLQKMLSGIETAHR